MASLSIDMSGRGGLAPKFFGDVNDTTGSPAKRIIAGEGQMAQGIYNPIKYYGYMSPASNKFTEISGTIAELLTCSVFDTESGDSFFGEKSTQLWGLTSTTDLSLFSFRTVTGAEFRDLNIYQVNGAKKLFYAYNKAGGGDIGIADIPFASANDTFMSGTTTSGQNMGALTDTFMVNADNGFMYIFDQNEVHKFDGTSGGGTNGTLTPDVLVFPSTFYITDALDNRGKMYMAVQSDDLTGSASTSAISSEPAGVYVWDRLTQVIRIQDFIPVTGVKEIRKIYVTPSGKVRIIVIGSDRFVQIREFNGRTFETIEQLGIGAYPEFRDTVFTLGGLTAWLGRDGVIYGHGKVNFNEKEATYTLGTLEDEYANDGGKAGAALSVDASGSVETSRQGVILTYADGSNDEIKKWFPHGEGTIESTIQYSNQGNIYTPVKLLPQMSTVKNVEIFCARGSTTGTATQATLKFYFNQSSTADITKSITRDDVAKGFIDLEINKPYVNTIQIEVEYPTDIAMSDNYDFRPSLAVINYEPTKTKGSSKDAG